MMGVMGGKEEVVVGDGCDGWKEEVVVGDGCDGREGGGGCGRWV